MNLLKTRTPLNTWLTATWEEFINIADHPASAKLKGYYYIGRMRFEPMSTGSDHSKGTESVAARKTNRQSPHS